MVLNRSAALRNSSNARLVTSHPLSSRANLQISRRILLRNKQRGYASSTEPKQSILKEDLPWIIGAVVVTVPSTIYCLLPRNPVKDHHNDHPEKQLDEDSNAEEDNDTPSETTPDESEDENESEESSDSTPSEDSQSQDSTAPNGNLGEDGGSTSEDSEESQVEKPLTETTSKDRMKRNEGPETAGGLPMGMRESTNEGETGSARDKAAASKESLSQNQMSGKQAGISNTPTKHSLDPTHHPQMSKKAEGAPETAKLQGTVKSNRPSSDNKEKFGEDKL